MAARALARRFMTNVVAAATATLASASASSSLAVADSGPLPGPRTPSKVGEFSSAGLIFRDTVEITSCPDPKVDGVVLHLSNVKRPITDRLSKDFFSDPSSTSIACTRTGPVRLLEPIAMGPDGEEVFSARRSLLFKDIHVRRIYDAKNHCLVYVVYSWRISQDMKETNSRFRTSIATIGLHDTDIARA